MLEDILLVNCAYCKNVKDIHIWRSKLLLFNLHSKNNTTTHEIPWDLPMCKSIIFMYKKYVLKDTSSIAYVNENVDTCKRKLGIGKAKH